MDSSTVRWIAASAILPLLGLLLSAQDAPLPPAPVNAGFEEAAPSGAPAGWGFSAQGGALHYRFESAPGRSRQGGHLLPTGPVAASDGAMLSQAIDARPWRGKRIRVTAALKIIRPGANIGMFVTVIRPRPATPDNRTVQVSAASSWTDYGVTIPIADDAETIWIGLALNGDAELVIDDVGMALAPPPAAAPPSAEAEAYLMRAIDLIRSNHINTAHADWPRIIADAHTDIGGAVTTADTYPAIGNVLAALGEKHSFLRPPSSVATGGYAPGPGGAPPEVPMPTSALVDGRFGVVRLPMLGTSGPLGEERATRYAATLRGAVETLDKGPLCGWIVDLRENGGGNMWPMLTGLDPLLGAAPFGWVVYPNGRTDAWQRIRGRITSGTAQTDASPAAFVLAHGDAPVAILLGPHTASSGEITAVALTGRPGVRSFGSPTAGFTSANVSYPLSDGAQLMVTTSLLRDRTGKDYAGPMIPDVRTGPEDAQAEAIRWLTPQCKTR